MQCTPIITDMHPILHEKASNIDHNAKTEIYSLMCECTLDILKTCKSLSIYNITPSI